MLEKLLQAMDSIPDMTNVEKFYNPNSQQVYFNVTSLDSNGHRTIEEYRLDDTNKMVFVNKIG